jgi:sugar lactone lactonase YvrE
MKHHSLILFAGLIVLFASCKKSDDASSDGSTITPKVVTTMAGNGTPSYVDGSGSGATFNNPKAVTADADGNVYVCDTDNRVIRKITPAGVVTTFAGGGPGSTTNGTGTAASFQEPIGITIDASGNLYVADRTTGLIRKITPAAVVTTFAGGGSGSGTNGTGTAASFAGPVGLATDKNGNIYVAEESGCRIRKITPSAVVSTLAGSGTQGTADGTGTAASFTDAYGIGVSPNGNVYVASGVSNTIRKITPAGVVTTFAGSATDGETDGTGTAATFGIPTGVAVDNNGNLYVSELGNHIRKITPSGVVTTFAGSTSGFADGTGADAQFAGLFGICLRGNYLYAADANNNRIRKISK